MESPLSSVPRPLSQNLDSSLSPCPLLDLSVSTEPHLLGEVAPPLFKGEPVADCRRTGGFHEYRGVKAQHGMKDTNQLRDPTLMANLLSEGAGLNTTLTLRAELLSVQGEKFDVAKAVKEMMDEKQNQSRTRINNRITKGVSFSSRACLYSSLVSVHVPESHVIKEAVLKLPLAAAPRQSPAPPSSTGPSPLPLTLNFFYCKPLPFSPSPSSPLKPRPHSASFSLFQKQQQWNTSP